MKFKTISLMAALAVSVALYNCGNDRHPAGDEQGHGREKEKSETAHEEDEINFTKTQAKAAGLVVETVKPTNFSEVIKSSGQVLSALGDETTIAATSNGIVSFSSLALTEGSAVRKGQTLFTISAKNIVDGDPAAKARIEFETAKKEFERAESLVKDKIISVRDWEQARLRYETARIGYSGVSSNAGGNGVKVSSTLTGFIKNKLVKQGEYVSIGQPVAIVAQNKRLILRAEVSERYFNQLKNIGSANFKMSYDSHEVFKLSELNGRLLSFGKASSDESYYLPITFEFDNVGNVVPGSFAEIYLLGNSRGQVISVPETALTEEQGLYYVYIQLDEESYRKQEVKIGSSNGERVEILSGLRTGEKVVVKGALQVKLASAGAAPENHSH